MKIETLQTSGFEPAIRAMRNPMDSWTKSDSKFSYTEIPSRITGQTQVICTAFEIGSADKDLSLRLQKAGTEHCKHLRMIMVWANIKAPLLWWKEFDTYRNGVEKLSCSTMHTLMKRPLTPDDFEHDCMNDDYLHYMIDSINTSMEAWRYENDETYKKQIWRSVIQALPESYLQQRTVMMSYAALRNIVRQREGHKLSEWKEFIDWAKTLPESWMIFE